MGISEAFSNLKPEAPRRATHDSRIVRIVGKEREELIANLMKDKKNLNGQIITEGMTLKEAEIEITKREVAATNRLAA